MLPTFWTILPDAPVQLSPRILIFTAFPFFSVSSIAIQAVVQQDARLLLTNVSIRALYLGFSGRLALGCKNSRLHVVATSHMRKTRLIQVDGP